jgi:hypothetical protein
LARYCDTFQSSVFHNSFPKGIPAMSFHYANGTKLGWSLTLTAFWGVFSRGFISPRLSISRKLARILRLQLSVFQNFFPRASQLCLPTMQTRIFRFILTGLHLGGLSRALFRLA